MFIEVTDKEAGTILFIRLEDVSHIRLSEKGTSMIYCGRWLSIKESYREIKQILIDANLLSGSKMIKD